MKTLLITLSFCLCLFTSDSFAFVQNDFDYDPLDTSFSGGPGPGNFVTTFGGLLPTAGNEFFASGNGNSNITFNDQVIQKNLGATIGNTSYFVRLNIAWYNDGQDGGLTLLDFNDLYIGSALGTMQWFSTPEPVNQDQWYTWEGLFTPDATDVGQPWMFLANYDLGPNRDIALDLPETGFAQAVPEPATIALFGSGLLFGFTRRKR